MSHAATSPHADRADRCGSDHALPRELLELSGQGDGVRGPQHDARLRGLSGAPGSLDQEPAALDEGTEAHTLQLVTKAHRSFAYGGGVELGGARRWRLQLASVGDSARCAVRHWPS